MARSTATLTFLFTNIEGSASLAQRIPDSFRNLMARPHAILRAAIIRHGGEVFDIMRDAFCISFADANDALAAALEAQRALQQEPWEPAAIRVQMGLHTGVGQIQLEQDRVVQQPSYLAFARTQRIMFVAHGDQILVSNTTAMLLHDVMPPDVSLLDLGEIPLKGWETTEHLWQVVAPGLRRDFPRLVTPRASPRHLPHQLTNFVGREREIEQIVPLIVTNRLVTLTGSGGAGKTRLAFEVAARLRSEFSEGIRVAELASLSDPNLVLNAVAQSAGLFDPRGDITLERLAGYLEHRELLLILDNCEHVVAACAELAQTLLRAGCLDLRVLCTSREPLAIPGEITWRVPPLAIPPSLAEIDSFDAVRLFVKRAQAVLPDFALTAQNAAAVAEICRRLDGMPLAIELAAARVRVLTVQQIAQRLGHALDLLHGSQGAIPRHRTMRAAIDWSYGLLDDMDAAVLRRLSVFSAGATLPAVEFACADMKRDAHEMVDSLARLEDKSLLNARPGASEMRYHMLEVIRQFGIEQLEQRGEEELARERHLAYYLGLAERIRPELRTEANLQRLELLDLERDNMAAALRYALKAADDSEASAGKALRLASSLEHYWRLRGPLEGMAGLRTALAARAAGAHPTLRAQASADLANLAWYHMGQPAAQPLAEESIALWHQAGPGNASGFANAIRILGMARWSIGDNVRARELFSESLRLLRETADELGQADVLWNLGATWVRDNNVLAEELSEQAIAIYERYGDTSAAGRPRYQLAHLRAAQGDFGAARSLYEACLEGSRAQGHAYGISGSLLALARMSRLIGDIAGATAYYSEQIALDRHNSTEDPDAFLGLAYVRCAEGEHEQAVHLLQHGLALYQKLSDHGGLAACLVLAADMKRAARCPKDAAQLLGAAKAQLEPLGGRPYAHDQDDWDRCVQAVRLELSVREFDEAWTAGKRMSLGEALQLGFRPGKAEPAVHTGVLTPLKAMKAQYGGLTAREREVAAWLARGISNRDIADELVVSERTVEAHIGNILGKLEFSSRTQIATWALEKGLAS